MIKFLHPISFLLSFGIGMLFVYLNAPKPELVVKFPSPLNAGKIKYKDKHDNCYYIRSENTSCPSDKSLIKPQPLLY